MDFFKVTLAGMKSRGRYLLCVFRQHRRIVLVRELGVLIVRVQQLHVQLRVAAQRRRALVLRAEREREVVEALVVEGLLHYQDAV